MIRPGSAEEEVRKHWDRVTEAWKQTFESANKDDKTIQAMILSMVQLYSMLQEWMMRVSKRLVSRRRKNEEAPTSSSAVHG